MKFENQKINESTKNKNLFRAVCNEFNAHHFPLCKIISHRISETCDIQKGARNGNWEHLFNLSLSTCIELCHFSFHDRDNSFFCWCDNGAWLVYFSLNCQYFPNRF